MTIELKFRYKTSDGRVLLPIIHVDYKCKKCGFTNELVMLTGEGHQFVDASKSVPHDSLCHKCDDVEIITIEQAEQKPAEWVGLTKEEAADCWSIEAVRTWHALESKLKEKNV